jgi:hypothetical protein
VNRYDVAEVAFVTVIESKVNGLVGKVVTDGGICGGRDIWE